MNPPAVKQCEPSVPRHDATGKASTEKGKSDLASRNAFQNSLPGASARPGLQRRVQPSHALQPRKREADAESFISGQEVQCGPYPRASKGPWKGFRWQDVAKKSWLKKGWRVRFLSGKKSKRTEDEGRKHLYQPNRDFSSGKSRKARSRISSRSLGARAAVEPR